MIHVGDHDIARPRVLHDGCCHQADRAGSRDQYVFAKQRKRKSRMHCVAQRIEDRRDVAIDGRVVVPDIGHWQRDVLGKRAGPIDSDTDGMGTQMASSRQAVSAAATDNMSFSADDLACVKVRHVCSDFDHLADKFVSDHHRHGNGLLSPVIPLVYVYVCSTNTRLMHADQNVVDADFRLRHIFEPESGGRFLFYERFHQ